MGEHPRNDHLKEWLCFQERWKRNKTSKLKKETQRWRTKIKKMLVEMDQSKKFSVLTHSSHLTTVEYFLACRIIVNCSLELDSFHSFFPLIGCFWVKTRTHYLHLCIGVLYRPSSVLRWNIWWSSFMPFFHWTQWPSNMDFLSAKPPFPSRGSLNFINLNCAQIWTCLIVRFKMRSSTSLASLLLCYPGSLTDRKKGLDTLMIEIPNHNKRSFPLTVS